MSKNQWIQHQGKDIFFVDCSNSTEEEFISIFTETGNMAEEAANKAKAEGGILRTLMDFTGVSITTKIKNLGAQVNSKYQAIIDEKEMKQYICVVGITGLKKTIVSLINRDVHYVDALEEGKDWIVSQ